ncbi:hypothetical protein SBDP1_250024 [Syntrophobacter sp. SbD1]|nr:hypothetical protein SBDP1_250024 [Syntrophobacter sp. SbD1]
MGAGRHLHVTARFSRRMRAAEGRAGLAVRPGSIYLWLSTDHDGSYQTGVDSGAHRRRDHCASQPVLRNDEICGRLVQGGREDRSRHAVRDGLGGPRHGTAGALGSGHERTLLRHCALRHVEQRLRIDRQANDRNQGGKLPDRGARLAGHAASRCQFAAIPLVAEMKWLPQMDTLYTLKGDYVWFKASLTF